MAPKTFRFKSQAHLDALEIFIYIAPRNLKAADTFLQALEETCAAIAGMPQIGKQCTFKNTTLRDMRVLPVRSFRDYLIFYRLRRDEIEVVRILHGARHLPPLLST